MIPRHTVSTCAGLLALAALVSCGPQPVTDRESPANPPPTHSPTPSPIPAVTPTMTPGAGGAKALLMHYMPWYETPDVRGRWGVHWTGHERQHDPAAEGPDGQPDIWSNYHPLIGLYDSTDPDVLECQLLQMKLAGVDGVIVDWYGIGDAADYPPIHQAAQEMFAAAGKMGMTFAACYEDRSAKYMSELGKLDDPNRHLADTFRWMEREWFGKPQYFRLEGRPLVLNFGPMFYTSPEAWSGAVDALQDKPQVFALHHLWQGAGLDGGFSWVHWEPWDGDPKPEMATRRLKNTFQRLSTGARRLIVSAFPGFNDVYVDRHRELAHRDGETLRESLAAAMSGEWPVVQLITWNDYGEGTIIEPTHEFGYKFLEIIQEARRAEVGETFSFTPEDLRLPARLLDLRRQNMGKDQELDRIAALLSAGRAQEARRAISAIEKP